MRSMPLALILLGLSAAPTPAQPQTDPRPPAEETAATKKPLPKEIQDGYALIYSGQIETALEHFRRLAEKDPLEPLAQKAIRPLTQAVQLRKLLGDEKHQNWTKAAEWLYTFYTKNRVPQEAQALCERVWKRFPGDPTWGLRLAEACASLRKNEQALAVYEKLLEKDQDPEILALTAVLLARMGREEDACAYLDKIPKALEGPALCYNIACAFALLGEAAKAGHCLKRSFELTPPSKIEEAKKLAQADEDLAFLRGTEEMEAALQAKSTVPEPKCESGSSCDGCPSKGQSGGCGGEKK